jgi:quercetin dioxygenase-like cupin family protein
MEKSYTARYLEAVITPGQRTPVHTHAGPEAWYLVAGTECLETPEGITVAHAGDSAVVKEGTSNDAVERRHCNAQRLRPDPA